jgi:hypothetical protein
LPKNKWTFAGVEETVSFKFLRSFYKMANNNVHSGAKGMLHRLGMYNQNTVMLAGPSNYGLADPGQNTAYSLFQVSMTLTNFESYLEDTVYIGIGMDMLDLIGEEFVRVQREIELESDSMNY